MNYHVPPEDVRLHPKVLERFKELNLCTDPAKWPYEDRDEWRLFCEQGAVMLKYDKMGHEQMGKDWYMLFPPTASAAKVFKEWVFDDGNGRYIEGD